jgi:hypothetical protein
VGVGLIDYCGFGSIFTPLSVHLIPSLDGSLLTRSWNILKVHHLDVIVLLNVGHSIERKIHS